MTSSPNGIACWGKTFASVADLARDPRCVVPYTTLRHRILHGWHPEHAARTPAETPVQPREVEAFGEVWPSLKALSKDERCVVTYWTLKNRVRRGWTPEDAASIPVNEA